MTDRNWQLEYETQKARADGLQRSRDQYILDLQHAHADYHSAVNLANRWWRCLIDVAKIVGLKDTCNLSGDLPEKVREIVGQQT